LHLTPVLLAYEAKIRLFDADKAAARAWLENYFVTEQPNPGLSRTFVQFTTARAYIVLGELDKAQRLCEMLKALAGDFQRLLDEAEASVLLSVVLWLSGKKAESAALLEKTLAALEPYGFVRVFADEGGAILPVLKKLMRATGKSAASPAPGSRYLQEVYIAAYEQSKRCRGIANAQGPKPVRLSRQQKAVLEMLAKGYKNAQIVQVTGLSINTIRSHTKGAYRKLEAASAAQAVARARELSLID
jgi:LuxR family maltose regulon positive regulatory protein